VTDKVPQAGAGTRGPKTRRSGDGGVEFAFEALDRLTHRLNMNTFCGQAGLRM